MAYSTDVVRPERAGGGALVQASCTCGWLGVLYDTDTTRAVEGRRLAERDATAHHNAHLTALCNVETDDGNRDDPTAYYCGHPRNHAGDHGAWWS